MESWIDIRPVPDARVISRREAEGLAWRAIVREHLGRDTRIAYNHRGAPVLENKEGFIGVSHTRGWVGVVWSPRPCAIDIEPKTRILSPETAARMDLSPDIADWCRREALYKYSGLAGSRKNGGKGCDEGDGDYGSSDGGDYGSDYVGDYGSGEVPDVKFLPHSELVVAIML